MNSYKKLIQSCSRLFEQKLRNKIRELSAIQLEFFYFFFLTKRWKRQKTLPCFPVSFLRSGSARLKRRDKIDVRHFRPRQRVASTRRSPLTATLCGWHGGVASLCRI